MAKVLTTTDGATFLSLDALPLLPSAVRKAEKELGESEEKKEKCIQTLRNMIDEQTEFVAQTDDMFLLRFLRARKFNCDRAFALLRNYYWFRVKFPQVYGDFRPSSVKDYLFKYCHTILPYRDQEGRPIFLMRSAELDPERTPFHIAIRLLLFSLETLIEDENTQVNGFTTILDCRNMGFRFLRLSATPANFHCLFCVFQDCFPGRFKKAHVIFESSVVDLIYAIAKPFLTKKYRERLYFHGHNLVTLHKHFSPAILPANLGGTLSLTNDTAWAKKLLDMDDALACFEKYGFPSQSTPSDMPS